MSSNVAAEPAPLQWWGHKKHTDDRAYFIGRTPNGEMVWQCEGDPVEVGNLDWSDWEHLPECDGWNWKPAVQYPQWCVPVKSTISPEHNVRIAYLRRDSATTGETFLVNGESFAFDNINCKLEELSVVTESEAMSYVNPHWVKIPSNVMGQSPDDWVDITDPNHVMRAGVDMLSCCEGGFVGCQVNGWAGKDVGFFLNMNDECKQKRVCCRRKDLPVVNPPAVPDRIPVRLWVKREVIGMHMAVPVVARRDYAGDDMAEVLSDGNGGWFIERSTNAGN